MDDSHLILSIAYCGLICKLCFQAEKCDGCKSEINRCDRNLSDVGCFQKECCNSKGFSGCWECSELHNCSNGIYSLNNYSKVKAFALFIQKNGKEVFIKAVRNNMKKGLSVEKGKDYDNLEIEKVHAILRSGI